MGPAPAGTETIEAETLMSKVKPGMSLLLFPEMETPEADPILIADVDWSHSRRSTLFHCPRQYYYEYFGSNLRKAKADPRKEKLRSLKTLKNRFERAGEILHFIIRTFFKKAQQGELWEVDRLTSWAGALMAKDVAYSRNLKNGDASSQVFPPVALLEFYYGHPDREQQLVEITKRLDSALRNFYCSSEIYPLRQAGTRAGSLVETRVLIPNVECAASGVVDLAFEEGGRWYIADWKMGSSESVENLQLFAYGLWAHAAFKVPAEALRLCLVSLAAGKLKTFQVTETELNAARVRIIEDAQCMATLIRYGLEGVEEAFTPCAQARVCRLCAFQEICPEGQVARS